MMKISAVICELNPFHAGHRFIFEKAATDSDIVIAVMSGNFVQRGECAVYDKYRRAVSAVSGGANVCVEIPFPFSSSSAEYFAKAGVRIAENLYATDLWFGSECGDADALKIAAAVLDSQPFTKNSRAADARAEIIKKAYPDVPESILSSPNDILAVEYCRRASVNLHAVKRIDTESASEIRSRLYENDENAVSPDELTRLEFLKLRSDNRSPETAESAGGVGGRLYNSAQKTNDPEKLYELAATKRYTNSRLRRAALYYLCNTDLKDIRADAAFTRLLAADEKGRQYLSLIRNKCELPVITNASDRYSLSGAALTQYNLSEFSDRIYTLAAGIDDPAYFSKIHPQMI